VKVMAEVVQVRRSMAVLVVLLLPLLASSSKIRLVGETAGERRMVPQ